MGSLVSIFSSKPLFLPLYTSGKWYTAYLSYIRWKKHIIWSYFKSGCTLDFLGLPGTIRQGHIGEVEKGREKHESNTYITKWNAGLEETQAGIKIARRNVNNFRYADDTTLMAKSEEELKSLLMKVKVESEKIGLKLNIQKMKIVASDPITSWEIEGETAETVSDFILGGSKITADGDCSHEIKRRIVLGRKVMTKLDSLFKSRDITSPTKVRLVKAMVFPVVMYGCESWTVKKAELRRIVAFEL